MHTVPHQPIRKQHSILFNQIIKRGKPRLQGHTGDDDDEDDDDGDSDGDDDDGDNNSCRLPTTITQWSIWSRLRACSVTPACLQNDFIVAH